MSVDMWLILEWLGAITALAGSLIMASRRFRPSAPWAFWIVSNACYIAYFAHREENGLLLMSVCGFALNLLGLYQWVRSESAAGSAMTLILFGVALAFLGAAAYHAGGWIAEPSLTTAEWLGASLGISAAFLVSSRHKYSFMVWFLWCLGNAVLLAVTSMRGQYGVASLQMGFMLINVYGALNCFRAYRMRGILAKPSEAAGGL